VPLARAPLNPIDDDTKRSGGEQKHADDVNDTKECVAVRMVIRRVSDGW
jgi:hypothetical protein